MNFLAQLLLVVYLCVGGALPLLLPFMTNWLFLSGDKNYIQAANSVENVKATFSCGMYKVTRGLAKPNADSNNVYAKYLFVLSILHCAVTLSFGIACFAAPAIKSYDMGTFFISISFLFALLVGAAAAMIHKGGAVDQSVTTLIPGIHGLIAIILWVTLYHIDNDAAVLNMYTPDNYTRTDSQNRLMLKLSAGLYAPTLISAILFLGVILVIVGTKHHNSSVSRFVALWGFAFYNLMGYAQIPMLTWGYNANGSAVDDSTVYYTQIAIFCGVLGVVVLLAVPQGRAWTYAPGIQELPVIQDMNDDEATPLQSMGDTKPRGNSIASNASNASNATGSSRSLNSNMGSSARLTGLNGLSAQQSSQFNASARSSSFQSQQPYRSPVDPNY